MPRHPSLKPLFLDVSTAPYNVMASARQITQRLIDIRAAQTHTRPVAILMGEHHQIPVTQLLQYAAIKDMTDHGIAPAYGWEFSYDYLLQPNILPFEATHDPAILDLLSRPAAHRELFDTDAVLARLTDAPVNMIARHCENNGLSFQFNDAARRTNDAYEYYLLATDIINKRAARALNITENLEKIDFHSPKAMHIRNHVMTQFCIDQVADSPDQIIVHMLGDDHVMGNGDEDCPYTTSMTALCRKAGFDVLPVITHMEQEELPDDADMANALIFEGWQGMEIAPYRPHNVKRQINKTLASSGLPPYTPPSDPERRDRLNRFMRKLHLAATPL